MMENEGLNKKDDELNPYHFENEVIIENEIRDLCKAKYVGCGIWYIQHILSASIVKNLDNIVDIKTRILIVYICFIIYCKFIYCGICRHHASVQIQKTPITDKIFQVDDSSPMVLFEWFYNFHKSANINAGKLSPKKEEVVNYFILNLKDKMEISDDNYSYEKIQCGIWHYFFLLSTKCHGHEQISCIYYLILEFMPYLPKKQKDIFCNFCSNHRFSDALNEISLPVEQLCISFFDWIFAMYEEINSKSNIKVYNIESLKNVYFYLDICNKECDK